MDGIPRSIYFAEESKYPYPAIEHTSTLLTPSFQDEASTVPKNSTWCNSWSSVFLNALAVSTRSSLWASLPKAGNRHLGSNWVCPPPVSNYPTLFRIINGPRRKGRKVSVFLGDSSHPLLPTMPPSSPQIVTARMQRSKPLPGSRLGWFQVFFEPWFVIPVNRKAITLCLSCTKLADASVDVCVQEASVHTMPNRRKPPKKFKATRRQLQRWKRTEWRKRCQTASQDDSARTNLVGRLLRSSSSNHID